MKKSRRKSKLLGKGLAGDLQDGFIKGFVSTGLLAALRDGNDRRTVVRAALQGGVALAAASGVAGALARRSPGTALAIAAAGTAGLCMAGQITADDADA